MVWEFEKIGTKIAASLKSQPLLWGVGGAAVIGVGAMAMKGKSGISMAAASPDQLARGGSGTEKEDTTENGNFSDEISQKLEEIMRSRDEDAHNITGLTAAIAALAERQNQQYTPEYQRTEPLPDKGMGDSLMSAVDKIMKTPTFTYAPRDFSTEQVYVMAGWADQEQNALASGYAGTSKNPMGAGDTGMIVEYHPSGHVSFRPKSDSSPTPTPSTAAPGAGGDIFRAANDSGRMSSNRSALSAVTGKSGNLESQLSGMSQSEKLSSLKSAGLIQ